LYSGDGEPGPFKRPDRFRSAYNGEVSHEQ
jgi:hypothetical protein